MANPTIYYANLLASGTLSGTNTDSAFPVRRVADDDTSLPYPLISGTEAGILSGEVRTTLGTGTTRTHFVMARGDNLSGHQIEIISEDVGGGSSVVHATTTPTDDSSFVLALSGVVSDRRVWRVVTSGTASGLATPRFFEVMLAKQITLPRRPSIGVGREVVHQVQRLEIPGAAPFKFRLGDDLRSVVYQVTAEDSLVSGYTAFLRENDAGSPVWFTDDKGVSYWAELPAVRFPFNDQAGVNDFSVRVDEVPE